MDVVVIGGGLSGLATAHALEREAARRGVDIRVRVLEAEARTGGKLHSVERDGFLVEEAANGWLTSAPGTDALCAEVGLASERLTASASARRRWVVSRGRLVELEPHPLKLLASGVLSLRGKLRLLMEPWAKPPPDDDESLAAFARRRVGPEALAALIDAVALGVYAGDPEQLSVRSAYPRIAELERRYGGLMKGMRARMREARPSGTAVAARAAGPLGSEMASLRHGVGSLVSALRATLAVPPSAASRVVAVERRGGGFRVRHEHGPALEAERVVLAVPADAAASILGELDDALARELRGIPYAPVAVVGLGVRERDLGARLEGFGFLVPHREGRPILGCLSESTVFAHRAPDEHVMLRVLVGGARRPELAAQGEEALVALVREELRSLLGLRAAPVFVHVKRHERAIPQYVVGHAARVERIDAIVARHAGLYLTGNALKGASMNDCIAQAPIVAAKLLDDSLS